MKCSCCPNYHKWLLVGDNYKYWWQNPNNGDPHGCLRGKYKPFGKKNLLPSLKKEEEPFYARFENTIGNPFLTLLNIGRNAPSFLKNNNYIVLYGKTAFRFDFGTCKVPTPEYMHFHFHAFSDWGTSRGPKLFLKVLYNYYSKKNICSVLTYI